MPLKIMVPLNRVQQVLNGSLVLDHPQRCSRCGGAPADHYENHSLKLRIGPKRPGLYRQTYHISQPYQLKIIICQTCYRADFVTSMEEQEKDDTSLGRLARFYNRAFTLGGTIACAGLLLMTNLIQPDSRLGGIKAFWSFGVGIGGLIIMAAWLHQRYRMRKIVEELESAGISMESRPRADVRTPLLDDEHDPQAVPLEISIHDESWAAQCAAYYQFQTDHYTPGIFQGEEK